MEEKVYPTASGRITYWTQPAADRRYTLVFLPGLTADHRLFQRQTAYFQGKYPLLVWDPPGHGRSGPFTLDFTLMDKARWLEEILRREGIQDPVLIGQSMGGYVAQAYLQQFPGRARGFISIDSAPLQRRYVTGAELWMLKHTEAVYRWYPWKALLKQGVNGCAVSAYGRQLMGEMMADYEGDQRRYAKLAGHGFRILAEAMEADLPYRVDCPALLLCGEQDKAGSTKRYNKAWHEISGIPIEWIRAAGHNSNTDQPEQVNRRIESFLQALDP